MAKTITAPADANMTAATILYYNGSTYTARDKTGNTDLLDDSFAVDDCLYIAPNLNTYSAWTLRMIKLDIDTAVSAASYEYVWEFYTVNNTWEEIPIVEDDTQGFTVTGENYVKFADMTNWKATSVNSLNYLWIRLRVTAVTSPTEGGHQDATYFKWRDNKFTASGTSVSDQLNFDDLYQAVVDEGFAHIYARKNSSPYFISYQFYNVVLNLQGGYFKDASNTKLSVTFISGYWQSGYVTLGEDNAMFPYTGRYGSQITFIVSRPDPYVRWAGSSLSAYATSFFNDGPYANYSHNITMKGCMVEGNGYWGGAVNNITNCIFLSSFMDYTGPAGAEYNVDGGYFTSVNTYSNPMTVYNASLYNANIRAYNHLYLYDCTELATVGWTRTGGVAEGKLYEYKSLTSKIIDVDGTAISGATVRYEGDDGSSYSLTSDANGDVELKYFLYKLTEDTGGTPDITTYDNVTVTVSKTGYQTKTLVLDISSKLSQIVVLENRREI